MVKVVATLGETQSAKFLADYNDERNRVQKWCQCWAKLEPLNLTAPTNIHKTAKSTHYRLHVPPHTDKLRHSSPHCRLLHPAGVLRVCKVAGADRVDDRRCGYNGHRQRHRAAGGQGQNRSVQSAGQAGRADDSGRQARRVQGHGSCSTDGRPGGLQHIAGV